MRAQKSSVNIPDAEQYRSVRSKAHKYNFHRSLQHPAQTIFRYIGQVDMLNLLVGNPRPEYNFIPQGSGGSISHGIAKKGGLTLEYDELPYEWNSPYFARSEIFHTKGPLKYMGVEYALANTATGCEINVSFGFKYRGWGVLGRLLQIKIISQLKQALNEFDRLAKPDQDDVLGIAPFMNIDTRTNMRRDQLAQEFLEITQNQSMATRLAEFILEAPDKLIARIRPLQIADSMGLAKRELIEFFLRSTKAGLFNLSWDILCPGCRGNKSKSEKLSDLKLEAHCDYCNIQYNANFSSNVELTFRPTERIRKTHGESYCINAPGNTGFVFAQFNVWPDQYIIQDLVFSEKNYQLQSPQFPGKRNIEVTDDGLESLLIDLSLELDGNAKVEPLKLNSKCRLEFHANQHKFATIKIYRDQYRDFALTADRVSAMHEFREQFGSDVLAPGLQIGIENLCFLFTDLKDSTPMYERMGDANAFALVRDHFNTLMETIRQNNGAVVKTIGDAVMAVFISASDAASSAFQIQEAIHLAYPSVSVKIGLHAGPCLAVNSNDKLDYFGTTVNRAARIQGLAEGKDIVMSSAFEKSANLAQQDGFERNEFFSTLKGISEKISLVRWSFLN